MTSPDTTTRLWSEYLEEVALFDTAIRLQTMIRLIKRTVPLGGRLLEVGFGSGATAVLLADQGYRVTAIDVEEALVARFRGNYGDWIGNGRLQVIQADMLALPWDDRVFDLVYHQGVLEHFPDQQIIQALREQCRVAGWVIFDVPNDRHGAHPFGDERLLPFKHWKRLIAAAGLRLEHVFGRQFPPWCYLLPHGLFSRRGTESGWPGLADGLPSRTSLFARYRHEVE